MHVHVFTIMYIYSCERYNRSRKKLCRTYLNTRVCFYNCIYSCEIYNGCRRKTVQYVLECMYMCLQLYYIVVKEYNAYHRQTVQYTYVNTGTFVYVVVKDIMHVAKNCAVRIIILVHVFTSNYICSCEKKIIDVAEKRYIK